MSEPSGTLTHSWLLLAKPAYLRVKFSKCHDVWLSGKQVELRREGLLPLQGTPESSSGRN
jgi:hypothetical protein